MSGSLYFPVNKATDANDDPASGAKARFFDTGTTTPQTVYSDASLTTPHPVPLIADSSGVFATIFTAGATQVKVTVTDSDDVTLPGYPLDPAVFQSSSASASTVAFTPTARISATTVQAAIEEVDGFVEAIEDARDIALTIETTAGSGNAYTASITGVTAYTATDVYLLKLDRDNTGAVTINVNAIGTKDVKKTDDTGAIVALAAGDWYLGEIHRVLYDGTQFVVLTPIQPTVGKKGGVRKSTSAENIAGTETTSTPDVAGVVEVIDTQIPARVVAWVLFDGVGTVSITNSFNVSSITDNGTGDYTINFTSALASADYAVFGNVCGRDTGVAANRHTVNVLGTTSNGGPNLKSTTQVRVVVANGPQTQLDDMPEVYISIIL